ncbi:MAG TPA: bifunctional PIG-L family deacetylase/class I SAM-dependent methyltransferase [Galbitalea sp.]
MVKFDSAAAGTAAREWESWGELVGLPFLAVEPASEIVVVAAHPDDETLGAGGLIAEAGAHGIPVTVIVVTDGAASHPSDVISQSELRSIRSDELREAVRELNADATVHELAFPDGHTDEIADEILAALSARIPPDATIVAPWRGDGHRDHRIVGEVCARLARERGTALLEYPIWMWHWASPHSSDAPWDQGRALELSPALRSAKGAALERYRSQTHEFRGVPPVLRDDFLEHFGSPRELFFVTDTDRSETKTEEYFDGLYARNSDPWRLSTRWYEARKRRITVASLPRRRYGAGLEIGCSVGELTATLADRCDSLLAVDISGPAVELARERTSELDNVRIEQLDAVHQLPDETFDLVVLSEVAYYWDLPTLRSMIDRILDHLSADGMVLACHWRHAVADYPLSGDQVHEALRASDKLARVVAHEEEDFVLEIFALSPDSVARREGLLG